MAGGGFDMYNLAAAVSWPLSVEGAGGMLDATGSTLASGPLTLSGGTFAARSFAATEVTVEGDADTVSVLAAPLSSVSGERASVRQPGLYTRYLNNSGDFDSTLMATAENMTCVSTNLDYAQASNANGATIAGEFPNSNLYCIYDGYIWNRSGETVTWTFGENFDDNVRLTIDGAVVLNNDSYNTPTKNTVTLSPGPHAIRIGLYQGTGGSGPFGTCGWVVDPEKQYGLFVDFDGGDSEDVTDYVPLTATCHGGANPLLTTEPYLPGTSMIPSGLDVAVSGSGTVDLGGAPLSVDTLYSGAAGITNGALTVTGDWVVDYADVAAGATLKVGSINLTGATLAFTGDASALDPAIKYTILEAEGAITGTPALDGLATGWVLRTIANKIVIAYPRGLVLIVR